MGTLIEVGLTVLILHSIFWILFSAVFYKPEKYEYQNIKKGRLLEERTKTYYNFFAFVFNIRDGTLSKHIKSYNFKPKTELDRQIADEEKEIKFLTEQKDKIDRLERLKRKKDRLYQEVEKDAHREDMNELGASEYERQNRIPELKVEFNQRYEDEMFELSKSDDPEIKEKAIAELKEINPSLGSMVEKEYLRREKEDEDLKKTRRYFEQELEKAKKEVSDASDLVGTLQADEAHVDNLKAEDLYRCEQCGSTKVTGYRRDYGDGGGTFKYFEHCSDCGIH